MRIRILLAVLGTLLIAGPVLADHYHRCSPVGTWLIDVRFPQPGPAFQELLTFNGDRTLRETNTALHPNTPSFLVPPGTPPTTGSDGYGAWKRLTGCRVQFSFLKFVFAGDAEPPLPPAEARCCSARTIRSIPRRGTRRWDLSCPRALVAAVAQEAKRRDKRFVWWATKTWNAEAQAFSVTVSTFFLAPWARGHALAPAILEACEDEARREGFEALSIGKLLAQLTNLVEKLLVGFVIGKTSLPQNLDISLSFDVEHGRSLS